MDLKDIFIIILIFALAANNYQFINKWYKKLTQLIYPPKKHSIQADLSLIETESNYLQKYIKHNINTQIKDDKLKKIVMYSLNNGKRVRPVILTSIYKKLSNALPAPTTPSPTPTYVIQAALFIEYIHCASLIMDDIMDNDDIRRDKLSTHAKYGDATAQLSAVIICSIAVQNLFSCFKELNTLYPNVNKNLPIILGDLASNLLKELAIGQYIDTSMPQNLMDLSQDIKINTTIEDIIHKKTSSLFEFCFILPWVLISYDKSDEELQTNITRLKNISRDFGLIFQIADDFEDVEKDLERNGKNMVMNYVIQKGYDVAYNDYHDLVTKFMEYDIMTSEIKQMIEYLNKKVDVFNNNKFEITL